ncbi:MAG TPA: glutamate--tRNA ligase [Acidimicrobiales bacterium]|nr:glutamate--tRNA ligase [Acidimicrobiales bacterium]
MAAPVRVRFAPSPTGMFHVGGARTALWNWLFARQHGGVFVLRVEDTDETRNEEQWVDGIHAALRWLELDWDEEYRQSEHAAAHAAAARRLYEAGRAYYCDCTSEAVAARKPPGASPGYDNFCRDRGLGPGPGRALRFRIPPGQTVIDDVVRGRVEFDNDKLGGDFVIVKSNGGPIFYLANTVDDLDERVSHVLRAEEHLPNTPKNQLLWEALAPDGPQPPVWAHLPVLVNEARKKLSKRRDKVALESFRDEGYLPEAMRNYLCLLGWSPGGDREFMTLEEMVANFRLEDVGLSPAYFDTKKLDAFNEHYIRAMSPAEFTAAAQPFLDAGPWDPAAFDPAAFAALAPEVQTRVTRLSEVPELVEFLFVDAAPIDTAAWESTMTGPAADILASAAEAFAVVAWEPAAIADAVRTIADAQGMKVGKAQAPIRVAVMGRTRGLPLWDSLAVLGRRRALERIEAARARLA